MDSSRLVTSMNAQLSMFDLPTSSATGNATSSPASGCGPSRCAVPGGPMIAPSGPDPAHANLSARQAKEVGLLTSGTSGRRSTGLSRSVALQSLLASRLAARTASLGSTLYSLTWIKRVTPAGHSIPALRASAPRTSGSGSTGWPTPGAGDSKQSGNTDRWFEREQEKAAHGIHLHMHLSVASSLTGWPTPTSALADKGVRTEEGAIREALRNHGPDLAAMVAMAGWPTPMAGTPAQKGYNAAGNTDSSRQTVALLSGWPTPVANDDNKSVSAHLAMKGRMGGGRTAITSMQVMVQIAGPARLTASGVMLTGSDAGMESGGQLHPEHSLWLQLGPCATAWARCAERVTLSTSRKPKPSARP